MGQCSYCGQPAGLFRSYHKDCEAKHIAALRTITSAAQQAVLQACDLGAVQERLRDAARRGRVSDSDFRTAIVEATEQALSARENDTTPDHPYTLITHEQEAALSDFLRWFNLAVQPDLAKNGWATRLALELTIRDVLEGKVPAHFDPAGLPMFNLAGGESIVWGIGGAELLKEKTVRTTQGYYGGPSIRIARGVYWRMGGFQARPISHTEVVVADVGVIAFGTVNLYFGGSKSDFRLPWAKVVAFHPYSDGFTVSREGTRAKPATLRTGSHGELLCVLGQALAQAKLGVSPRRPRGKAPARVTDGHDDEPKLKL